MLAFFCDDHPFALLDFPMFFILCMVQQHVVATGHLGIQTLCSMFGALMFIHIYTDMFDIYISAFMIFYLSIVYTSVGLFLVVR